MTAPLRHAEQMRHVAPRAPRRPSGRARLLLVAALVLSVVIGGLTWRERSEMANQPRGQRNATRPAPALSTRVDQLAPLRQWDARRAAAYADGDSAALTALYTPQAAVGAVDRRLLRRYLRRGLVVREMRTQILAARVLVAQEDRVVLLVTDRLERAIAVGRGARIRLPAERPATRRIVLERHDQRWLVASARQASPVAMTSRTS